VTLILGLRYDDLLNEYDVDVKAAVTRISPEEDHMRTQRLIRACDLSSKHVALPKEIQEVQEPFKSYLADLAEQNRILREEREILQETDGF
jgi:ubiquinol-cytochrome c reductase subunit 7